LLIVYDFDFVVEVVRLSSLTLLFSEFCGLVVIVQEAGWEDMYLSSVNSTSTVSWAEKNRIE
jgi:hypothetical protein